MIDGKARRPTSDAIRRAASRSFSTNKIRIRTPLRSPIAWDARGITSRRCCRKDTAGRILAFFQITKSGISIRDFATSDPSARKLAGVQRKPGNRARHRRPIADRWIVIANYAHIDAKVISDNPKNPLYPFGFVDTSGLYLNHLDNTPRHSGILFFTYEFGEGGLGLRVGGGVTASSHAWGDLQNTFLIPGWARLDAFASYSTLYEGHKVTAQLNLRNLTNTRYYTGVDNFYNYYSPPLSALPAPPFTAMGTLRFEW